MKRELLKHYRSPGALAPLELTRVDLETADEIRAGELRCTATGRTFEIKDGAPHLIVAEHVSSMLRKDQALIEEFDKNEVTQTANNTWPEDARKARAAYEKGMQANTEFLFQTLNFTDAPNRIAIEIGAGDTKLAARMRGLGFTLFTVDFAGFRICSTADRYMPKYGYFERAVGLMAELPFATGTFDLVYMHASLHHATPLREEDFSWWSPNNLSDTLREIRRIMKPRDQGGMFILTGEGVYPENTPIADRHFEKSAQTSGCYESWYTQSEYEAQFRKTGLFPNIWSNQDDFVMYAYGYEPDGSRFDLLTSHDGLIAQEMYKVPRFWRRYAGPRLRHILPDWVQIKEPEKPRELTRTWMQSQKLFHKIVRRLKSVLRPCKLWIQARL